ncbi:MAG: hypothetical protein JRH10_12990 [Deltaproteobacteria bacterium]|nr:hypothetical protein [Deltaproteobacteria bacterium]
MFVSTLFPLHLPAADPSATALELAEHYRQNARWISLGSVMFLIGTIALYPFVVVVASQLRRIEEANHEAPLNSWLFLVTGTMAWGYGSLMPGLSWIAAAFRPDRNPEITQIFNDLAWFSFVMPFPPFTVMVLSLGIAILRDRTPEPLIPRWFGWLCVWEVLGTVPACLSAFYDTGPFAWNGFLSFWVPAVPGIGVFVTGSVVYALKAISRDEQYDTQLSRLQEGGA